MSVMIPDAGIGPSHQMSPRGRVTALLGLVGAVLVMLLSLTAFVGGSGQVEAQRAAVGEPAMDFSLRAANGHRIRLEQFRGRPVLLVFGAPQPESLPPVRVEGVAVIVVTTGSLDVAEGLSQRLGTPVIGLQDVGGEVALRYETA